MWAFLILILIAGAGVGAYFWRKKVLHEKLIEELQIKLLSVRLPMQEKEGRELKQEIARMEQLLSGLVSFRKPIIFEVAVPHVGEEISFYVSVPGRFVDATIRQIQSLWGDADVSIVEDYNIFNYQGATAGVWLKQREHFMLPFRTYQEIGSDTFLSILGGFSKINEVGEGAAFQVLVRPAPSEARKSIRRGIEALRKGGKSKAVFHAGSGTITMADVKAGWKGSTSKDDSSAPKIVEEETIKALETKFSKPIFEVNARLLVSAPNGEQADSILEGLTAGFSQFESMDRNELQVVKTKNIKNLARLFSFREFDDAQAMTLTSEEIASIFHFPTPFTDVPKIKMLRFREAPPPTVLPTEGVVLGESVYRGTRKEVRISKEDRRRHLYLIGQTGTGKSVTLNKLAGQDIANGEGVCLIDPNGDLFEDVLARVPAERAKDVVVFDPSDFERPLALNMLEYDPRFPEHKTFLINEMLNIFNTLYDLKATGGPMFEQYMRNALLLLMDDPADGYTLLEVPRLLSDPAFRKRLLEKCKNLVAKDFWEKEAEKAGGEAALANMVPYITSKFNVFIANDYMRPIIAQSKSSLNFREIMDEGKLLLVNLSKGKIGDVNASLLGMILVGKLTLAAFSRADVPMEQRRDFYLYIDEFQNFTTPSIATILSEARKYRLDLTVGHQFIAQLKEDIRNAIFGNVGSMVVFRVGADDAQFLAKQFEPVFSEKDLIYIDNLNAHAKLIVNGQVAQPFNVFIPFPPRGDRSRANAMKEYSRLLYGRNRQEVDEEIYKKLRL